jgi:DNA-binding MarR family transcriptional regulator
MARPTKARAVSIAQRNKKIIQMAKRGYPLVYIADYFNVTKGTISKIVKKKKGRGKKQNEPAS